ncbi:2,3-bisphosphoglycerate-independent phosphoglycerate mutase [Phytophthora ramorum]|uniref:2,3-bisphosphoglycerate-independent phosphoglycerate mutase n=1 Tax=Phytophthora ramorum TaxID=164328 RepID=UPI0030A5707E|nr:2,3-bisphosphoglycerate-independent phosphoglycerate mutase [Phytophthora ramorum]
MGDRGGISLLVRNISRRLRPEDIRKEFERYGEVRDVYIPKDFYTKEPKGFAFVEFRSEREADDARRSLDGVRIDGRDIRVVFAQERRKSTDQMRDRERTEKREGGRRSRSRSPRRRAPRGRAMKKRSVVFVLIDGLADVSLQELDQQTPLETAQTPAMDAIAHGGLTGLMDPVEPGHACGSDTAHMSILGYNPVVHYRGRGSFEAMGAGLPMNKGDVAFKCNFATVEENEDGQLIVERRRVDRNFPSWGIDLCSFLNGLTLPEFPGLVVATKYATEHRCGIVFKGPQLCDKITGTDPLKDHLSLVKSEPLNDTPEAAYSSTVLNAVSDEIHKRLSEHPINKAREAESKPPANVVLLRGPGERIDVPTFTEMHGLTPFMIAPTCIIAGLGMSLGFEIATAPGATGDYHTNLLSKAETALELLHGGEFDFGFVHVKAVDDAGHDRDVAKKVHFIERADEMIALLLEGIHAQCGEEDNEVTIVVTGDHTTPVKYGDHTFEPVPFAIARAETAYERLQHFEDAEGVAGANNSSPGSLTDGVTRFSELSVARGALGRFAGDQVMKLVKGFREYEL